MRPIRPTNRENSERPSQCVIVCTVYYIWFFFLHLWAKDSSFLSSFIRTTNIFSCIYRLHILIEIIFPWHHGMMCTQMWIRGSVTISQCPVILSPKWLKLITGLWEVNFFFKIFRNRICINTIAKALYNKFKKTAL